MSSDANAAPLPERIGSYLIQRRLGAGGMATVYAALQEQPRRTVAIKVMRDLPEPERALRRFRREIEILGKLHHPYIAKVFDAGMLEEDLRHVPYYVMEYVSGSKSVIEFAAERELDRKARLKLFIKICAAIEHGHQHRVIHRDLKPANILIDESGDPKIIDFGIAHGEDLDVAGHTRLSEDGHLVGTVQYMAPEQLNPAPVDIDKRCDVYALGAILYRLLTDRRHHDLSGLPLVHAVQIVQDQEPVAPSQVRPDLRGDLETIMQKALERDPARRYRSAGALGRDLLRFLANKPIHARPASRWYRLRLFSRRHKPVMIASAVSASILVFAAAGLIVQHIVLTRAQQRIADPAREVPPVQDQANPAGSTDSADSADPANPAPTTDTREARRLERSGPPAQHIAFSATGNLLAVAAEQELILYDLQRDQEIARTQDHEAPIRAVACSADGTQVLTSADDGQLVLLNADGGAVIKRIHHEYGPLHAIALNNAGDRIAIATEALLVHVLDVDGTVRQTIRNTRGHTGLLRFSPDGDWLAGVNAQFEIEFTPLSRGDTSNDSRQPFVLGGLSAAPTQIAFTEGGGFVALTDAKGGFVWETLAADAQSWLVEHPEMPAPLLASDGTVIRRLATGWIRHDASDFASNYRVIAAATPGLSRLAPGGEWLAAALDDGAIRLEPIRLIRE